jgi:hypothetical protein
MEMAMKPQKHLIILSASLVSFSVSAEDDKKEQASAGNVEEMYVVGNSRPGDYRFITEDTEKLVSTPGSFGDPLGAITALPGVIASETGQEPAVRGSSPDDNVFYVDFLPASYIFHEFGVSVFSEYILHDFNLYAAGFGAEYAGATGAVFDVTLRQPENSDLRTTLDISMLRSGVFFEGGVTENSAFYLSARRSMIDLFIDPDDASDEDEGINVLSLPQDSDYQFKYAWEISDENRLTFSANGATDEAEAEFTSEADFVRSNPDFAGEARLENAYNGQSLLFEHFGSSGRQFRVGANTITDEENVYWGSDYLAEITLKQQNVRGEMSVPITKKLRTSVGLQHSNYDIDFRLVQPLIVCTEFDVDCDLNRRNEFLNLREDFQLKENTAYVSMQWNPYEKFTLDLGAQYHEHETDTFSDSFMHPRISAALDLNNTTTLSFKAGTYNRFAELETVTEQTGNPRLQSPSSDHYVLGVSKELPNDWSVSLEGYYKTITDLPLALGEADPDAELRYINGVEGEARGLELMINKNLSDRWYGWMALSYSESERTNLRTGETANYFLDTPIVFSWVMNYQWKPKLNISGRLNVKSGESYTPIIGVQDNPNFENAILPVYGEPFSDRLPMYSRLDIRFKWDLDGFGEESAIILDILNVFNRQNVVERTLDFNRVNSVDDEPITKDTVGLGIIPALSYRVTF